MKSKVSLFLIVLIVILTGCNKSTIENKDKESVNSIPLISQPSEGTEQNKDENQKVTEIDLNTEKGIIEYLEGDWVYDAYYRGDVICKMNIDKDLNVHLSFKNSYSKSPKGDYSGKITFDRMYVNQDELPDLICIELTDKDNSKEDFLYMHRTIYDGKRVMSWFFAGNGNSIFELEDETGEFTSMNDEIIFGKVTGEKSQLEPYKNGEFYAVYWGKGTDKESIWLDDLDWTAEEEYDYDSLVPSRLTWYENDIKESILYKIVPEEIVEILGDELTEGIVYYVSTDEKGNVKEFISADRKRWIENGSLSYDDKTRIIEIIENSVDEIKYYLDLGMTIDLDGETIMLDGEECHLFYLGTKHEGYFVKEIHYAVQLYSQQIYRYDILNDNWEALDMN